MLSTITLLTVLALPGEGVEFFDGSFDDALRAAAKAEKGVFVDFSADW